MGQFATDAFAALTEAKKQFGEYTYHDKGPSEVLDMGTLNKQLRAMSPQDAAEALSELEQMEDAELLVAHLISNLDDWDAFFGDPAAQDLIDRHY